MPYRLDKGKTIGIYGYTPNGIRIKKYLEQNGFNDIVFIDKYVQGKTEIKIYSADQIGDMAQMDITVIISLQNAIAHQNIAEHIFAAGINRVIFLPASFRGKINQMNNMRKIYNLLIANSYRFDEPIPFYDELLPIYSIRAENGIIDQNNAETTFWMKTQNIFVNNARQQVVTENIKYYGRSLAAAVHYQALFEYYEKGIDGRNLREYLSAQNYLDKQGEYIKEKILDRYQLWHMYKRELNRGMDFFIASAPKVVMNDRGGLNITDGLHRCIFLYLQNLAFIPVKMDTDEFIEKYKTTALNDIIDFMRTNEITHTVTPIEHPAFHDFPCEKEDVEPSVLGAIQSYIGVNIIEQLSILDISDYNSYFARYISKMKLQNDKGRIVAVETEWKEYQFAKLLNILLGIRDVEVQYAQDLAELQDEAFDMTFVMGKSKEYKKSDRYLQFLDQKTKRVLFWETESIEEDVELLMQKLNFSTHELIMQYCNGEAVNKVIAFIK
ncbi:MAG: hypothetical protein HDR04_00780 [Lachnospiraceae bacterium]|nr:hypothetical protein [Lachnospiraceae bacterium]